MSIIFDGRAFASEKEEEIKDKVDRLRKKGVVPRLASILLGDDPASRLYVGLKKKAAERVGIRLEVYNSLDIIEKLNANENVHGIMIQLPLPEKLEDSKEEIIARISPGKDVDGLRDDSKFLHPTSKAVIDILHEAERRLGIKPKLACIVGERGMVGAPLVRELKRLGYELTKERKDAEILISCTGSPNLVDKEMVKDGSIVIDVGSPVGDVNPEVSEKASFITPVPGGVGPMTITCLLENLVKAACA